MNLHQIVRGQIQTVNPDITATYLASTGAAARTDFNRKPQYAAPLAVRVQVQPLSRGDLILLEKLQMEGVFRHVFLYGDVQGIVRVQARGGDLLQFPPFAGEPIATWKIVNVAGPWNVEQGGWTDLIVALQTDYVPQ